MHLTLWALPGLVLIILSYLLIVTSREIILDIPDNSSFPDRDENIECGRIRLRISRDSFLFRRFLVFRSNEAAVNARIQFSTEDARIMSLKIKIILERLASALNESESVMVDRAWQENFELSDIFSLHYEGRSIQIRINFGAILSLRRLAALLYASGCDWVRNNGNYARCSVRRDSCDNPLDLAFLLDASGSIGSRNFRRALSFIQSLVNYYTISPNDTQVSVVSFSTYINNYILLNRFSDKASLTSVISRFKYSRGWTRTWKALYFARYIFAEEYGARSISSGIPKIAILLTDGKSNGNGAVFNANDQASRLRDIGVQIYTVGIGRRVDSAELIDLASKPAVNYTFFTAGYDTIQDLLSRLTYQTCDEPAVTIPGIEIDPVVIPGDEFRYFKATCSLFSDSSITVSIQETDLAGSCALYVSADSSITNPGPLYTNSSLVFGNESNATVKNIVLPSGINSTIIYVALRGLEENNTCTVSIFATLFGSDEFSFAVAENSPSNQILGSVPADMPTPNTNYTYSILQSADSNIFSVNSENAEITVTGLFDRELRDRYTVTLIVQDASIDCLRSRTTIVLLISDENDNAPVFSPTQFTVNIREDIRIGRMFFTEIATDIDIGTNAQLQYNVSGQNGGSAPFSIDPMSASIEIAGPLDGYTNPNYSLIITATDSGSPPLTGSAMLTVFVETVNMPPTFTTSCPAVYTLPENQQIGAINSIIFAASDPDTGPPDSTINFSVFSNMFSIDPTSGQLSLQLNLDRENKNRHKISINVTDGGGISAFCAVTIDVTDINDNPPIFNMISFEFSLEEGRPAQVLFQVSVSDLDIGNNSLYYLSLNGNDSQYFIITSAGTVSSNRVFDFEALANPLLTFDIIATGFFGVYTAMASATINITDINDNAPLFSNIIVFQLPENAGSGTVAVEFAVSDADSGAFGTVVATLLQTSASASIFALSKTANNNYTINLMDAVLDFETTRQYSITIRIIDGGTPPLITQINIEINITDINDNQPICNSVAPATIRENLDLAFIAQILATDADKPNTPNSDIIYSIVSVNGSNALNSNFTINSTNGILQTNSFLDIEQFRSYLILVRASDQGDTPMSCEVVVILNLEDVNEFAPVINHTATSTNITIREDAPTGFTVATVQATDADISAQLTFSLSPSIDNFIIDSISGRITLASMLDFETNTSYTLIASVSDGNDVQIIVINIIVENVNDITPLLNIQMPIEIGENLPAGTNVTCPSVIDGDGEANGVFSLTLSSMEFFTFIPATFCITLTQPLDREGANGDSLSLTIIVNDNGIPNLQSSQSYTITILDRNDNPPIFQNDPYSGTIEENSAPGLPFISVMATDLDFGTNAQITYSLNSTQFSINASTGDIVLAGSVDFEATPIIYLQVNATDQVHIDTALVTITVTDVNDIPPTFDPIPSITITENGIPNTFVVDLNATDTDQIQTLTYSIDVISPNNIPNFMINSNTGIITVNASTFDREQTDLYRLTVSVSDGSFTAQANFTVFIADANDNTPSFVNLQPSLSILECVNCSESLLQASISDFDQPLTVNTLVTASINDSRFFITVNDNTASLFCNNSTLFDFETDPRFNVLLYATDSGSPALSSTALLYIQLLNCNDNPPIFLNDNLQASIPENANIDSFIAQFNASDADQINGIGITYSFFLNSSLDYQFFEINSTTGAVYLIKSLNFELSRSHMLIVIAQDSGSPSLTAQGMLLVTVIDVDDNPPNFTQDVYRFSLFENTTVNTIVYDSIQASDLDTVNNTIIYTLSNHSSVFDINSTTAELQLISPLNFEMTTSYTLTVIASSGVMSSTATVIITVIDVNDEPPVITNTDFSFSIPEDAQLSQIVFDVEANDPDTQTLTYLIEPNNTFTIDSEGVVTTVDFLDREMIDSYTVTVAVYDGVFTDSRPFNVQVTDINDNTPQFGQSVYTFIIKENATIGEIFNHSSALAFDADSGSNAIITYTGNAGPFNISSSQGNLIVAMLLDYETTRQYTFTVRATDGGAPSLASTAMFIVDIENINDNIPIFSPATYSKSIEECNELTGSCSCKRSVLTLSATDADNDVLSFALANEASYFTIDSATGVINSTCNLDFEIQNSFSLTATVSDGLNNESAQITFTITDINDNIPMFSPNSEIILNVYENVSFGTQLTYLNASDRDSSVNSLLEFSFNPIYPSGAANMTNILISGNEIILSNGLDFESNNILFVYELTVTDMGTPALSSSINLTINVLDVNDNSPVFNNSIIAFDIRENETPSNILCLTANDRDSGTNGVVSFSIQEAIQSSLFFNLSGCNLSLIQAFDRELNQSASITILAIDGGSPRLTSSISLTFSIIDLNDNTPQFSQAYATQFVLESSIEGSQVLTVSATDGDSTSPNSDINYSISNLANGAFVINAISGLITVGSALDFETTNSYTLNVTARDLGTDPQTNYNSTTITILIINVNDAIPQFTQSDYLFSIAENSSFNTEIGRTPATDADDGVFGVTLFAVQTNNNNTNLNEFRYNISSDNLIVLQSSVDFETQSVYNFRVIVSNPVVNGSSLLESVATVTVRITDVNDNRPIFDDDNIIVNISEIAAINTTVTQLFATDRDEPNTPNSQITFSINDTSFFNISQVDNQAVIYTISPLDRESIATHYLSVRAMDNGSPSLTSTANVTINIEDFNDNPPIFTNISQIITLPEDFPTGIALARFAITDVDIGLTNANNYSISNSNQFAINNNGNVTLVTMLDFESENFYNITITASDGTFFSNATLLVYVTDVNEAAPVFANLTYTVDLDENSALGINLIQVSANDADILQTISYALTSLSTALTSSSDLSIDNTTGEIRTNRIFDFEALTNQTLEYVLSAVDSGNPQRTGFATLIVNIINLNDNSPVFTNLDQSYTISENTAINETVFTLLVTDAETDTNLITYTLSIFPSSSAFSILTSGTIQVSSALDFETQSFYTLTITAFDNGSPQRNTSRNTIVYLTDFNDNAPMFSQSLYIFNISENSPSNLNLITISVIDNDVTSPNNVPTFSIESNIYVTINATTGSISTLGPINRETVSILTLSLGVCDNGNPQLCGVNSLLQVNIEDINDNPPLFVGAPYSLSLAEEYTSAAILTVSVTDIDEPGTPNSMINLMLMDTNCFTIDSVGQIFYSANFTPDFETNPILTTIIIATDSGSPPLSSSTTLTVNLIDVNDNAPVITFSSNTVGISEAKLVPSSVNVNISAMDLDSGFNGEIIFSLVTQDTLFTISPSTGILTLTTGLDFEVLPNTYSITIRATDRGVPPLSSTANLTLNVIDANDNSPVFPYADNFSISTIEEIEVPYSLINITTTDADSGANAETIYSLVTSTDNSLSIFSINQISGEITVNSSIDRESRDNFAFYIFANNTASPFFSTRLLLRVIVTDINDNAPSFNLITFSVSESRVPVSQLNSFAISDLDIGSNGEIRNVSISLSSPFSINMTSPTLYAIYLIGNLDFETTQVYNLSLTAYDNGSPPLFTTHNLIITVINENDNTPMFTQSPYTVSILESTTIGTDILNIIAIDADLGVPGDVNLSLSATNSFQLNTHLSPTSLRTSITLDYETRTSFTLTVTARDNGVPSRINTTEIIITILDVNDNAPIITFPSEGQIISVPESRAVNENILTVTATDADQANTPNSMISFSFSEEPNIFQYFAISSTTGQITLSSLLDFENVTQRMHNLTILATDAGSVPLSSSVNFIIAITDVNDNSPVFENSSITISVPENQQPQAIQFSANDNDSGPAGDVVYSIINNCDSNSATIQSNTGLVNFASQFDYEQSNVCTFQITALDKGDPQLNSTALLTVNVVDLNDNAPIFVNGTITSISLSEMTQVNTSFHTVLANDADGTSPNNLVSYSLGNTFSGIFAVNQATGFIYLSTQLDFEVTQVYRIEVIASDGGSPVMNTLISITINVIDANDNSPIFNPPLLPSVNVTENRNINFTVITAIAFDFDSGINAQIGYTLGNNGVNIPFIINNEGVIMVNGIIDRETIPSYLITVIATDMGTPSRSTQFNIIFIIGDVNDNPPVFTEAPYSLIVDENQVVGIMISQITVTDIDIDLNAELVCTIFPSNILNITSGFGIITNFVFDREELSQYSFTVSCSDISNSPLTSTAQLNLEINDTNDNSPILPANYAFEIREDAMPSTEVGTIQATDADDPNTVNSMFTFSIENNSTYFTINRTTGIISTANSNGQLLPVTNIVLIVKATDMGIPARNNTTSVNITIIDINNNPPIFTANSSTLSIPENIPVNTVIANVTAFDDESSNLNYSLISVPELNQFSIDNMGTVSVVQSLDYEVVTEYALTVYAVDQPDGNGVRQTGTTIILVQLIDINDNSPVFNNLPYSANLNENFIGPICFLNVSATDIDSGNLGLVTYELDSTIFSNIFSINSSSGEFCLLEGQFLNFEGNFTNIFNVPIIAMDQGNPSRNSRALIEVTINDINEFPPVFSSQIYNSSILEEEINGTPIASQIVATDADSGTNAQIIYSLNGTSSFSIDPNTAQLTTTVKLDREMIDSYIFTVIARDLGNPSLSSTSAVSITVLDINDNCPIFSNPVEQLAITEETSSEVIELTNMVTDDDIGTNAEIRYSFANMVPPFQVDSLTGQLSLSDVLDREAVDTYNITLVARDLGVPSCSSSSFIIVTVDDTNDNIPQFIGEPYIVNITEEILANTSIFTVTATDADQGENALFTLSIDPTTQFYIDPNSNTIYTSVVIDRETLSSDQIVLTITALEQIFSTTTASTTITINVMDINDNPPICSNLPFIAIFTSITSNMNFQLTVTDADIGENSRLTYSLLQMVNVTGTNTLRNFVINVQDNGFPVMSTECDVQVITPPCERLTISVNGVTGEVVVSALCSAVLSAQPQFAILNESVQFSCDIISNLPLTVMYSKNGDNIMTVTSSTTFTLSDLEESDAGSYTCSAVSSLFTITSQEYTLIIYIPPEITIPPMALTVDGGQNATFTCYSIGFPDPDHEWKLFSDTLETGSVTLPSNDAPGFNVTKNIITLDDAGFEYQGNYSCNASNIISYDEARAPLILYEPEDEVTITPGVDLNNPDPGSCNSFLGGNQLIGEIFNEVDAMLTDANGDNLCVPDPSDPCVPNPCSGGICTLTNNVDFSCECLAGLSGTTCLADINECLTPNNCQNGGICANTYGSYSCNCPEGYTNFDCSMTINCTNTSCPDTLTCVEVIDPNVGFECRNSTNITMDLANNNAVDMTMNSLEGEPIETPPAKRRRRQIISVPENYGNCDLLVDTSRGLSDVVFSFNCPLGASLSETDLVDICQYLLDSYINFNLCSTPGGSVIRGPKVPPTPNLQISFILLDTATGSVIPGPMAEQITTQILNDPARNQTLTSLFNNFGIRNVDPRKIAISIPPQPTSPPPPFDPTAIIIILILFAIFILIAIVAVILFCFYCQWKAKQDSIPFSERIRRKGFIPASKPQPTQHVESGLDLKPVEDKPANIPPVESGTVVSTFSQPIAEPIEPTPVHYKSNLKEKLSGFSGKKKHDTLKETLVSEDNAESLPISTATENDYTTTTEKKPLESKQSFPKRIQLAASTSFGKRKNYDQLDDSVPFDAVKTDGEDPAPDATIIDNEATNENITETTTVTVTETETSAIPPRPKRTILPAPEGPQISERQQVAGALVDVTARDREYKQTKEDDVYENPALARDAKLGEHWEAVMQEGDKEVALITGKKLLKIQGNDEIVIDNKSTEDETTKASISPAHVGRAGKVEKNLGRYDFWHGTLTRAESEQKLMSVGLNGAFLMRESSSDAGDYSLSILFSYKEPIIEHLLIKDIGTDVVLQSAPGSVNQFRNLQVLVEYYQANELFSQRSDKGITLSHPIQK